MNRAAFLFAKEVYNEWNKRNCSYIEAVARVMNSHGLAVHYPEQLAAQLNGLGRN